MDFLLFGFLCIIGLILNQEAAKTDNNVFVDVYLVYVYFKQELQ